MISWGVIASSFAFVPSISAILQNLGFSFFDNARTFYFLRFMLGAAEAGFFPGIVLYFTYWFTADERARWLGVFLTGSDTSANALFGPLQVVTATRLGLNPVLMAAANSGGGVVGKMISLQSIAVAAAATGMHRSEEGKLFRFTLRHSIFLAVVIGFMTMFYAYVVPSWVR